MEGISEVQRTHGRRSWLRGDLLATVPGRALLRASWFPVGIQVVMLGIAIWLGYVGWNIGRDSSNADLLILRKTNLTTLAVWGLWWPVMVVIALAFGRAWCTVCPMELLNRAGYRLAVWTRVPQGELGTWLRAGWFVVIAYVVLQVVVAGMSMHRVPYLTAYMLLVLGMMAFVTGVIYRRPRSFCHSFCPAKALLAVYGRFTSLQLDVRDPEVCVDCTTRECVDPALRDRFDKRSCPSQIAPFNRNPADGCVLCMQCAKVCPYDNIGVGLAKSTAGSRQSMLLQPYETVFVLTATGLVLHKVLEEVRVLVPWSKGVPTWLNGFAPDISFGWFEALWFLLLLPLLFWGVTAGCAYVLGYRGSLTRLLTIAATAAAPLVALGHVAKGAAKMSTWAGYLPGSLRDPRGLDYLAQYNEGSTPPGDLAGLPVLGAVMLLLLGGLVWWYRRRLFNDAPGALAAKRAGLYVMSAALCASLLAWILL